MQRRFREALDYRSQHGLPDVMGPICATTATTRRTPRLGSIRALGFPITPYETQWAEPVEVVRDRWLGVFADIVTRTWERMEEES